MLYVPVLAMILAAPIHIATAYSITGDDVNCRSGPGTSYDSIKKYTKGSDVTVTCQSPGESIFGNSLWDKTADGCYVADYYVKTGTTGYATDKCRNGDSGNGNTSGASIVSAAQDELGIPYVWGGGGCDGPSSGGFDCSGLTQYAICKSLNFEIPRVAQDQYDSNLGTRLPRAEAKQGDLIFWGNNGNCDSGVVHVAIFIKEGWMINAARTGTPVREQAVWTSYGGEEICPYAVRFW
ncbi:hypothetical protein BDV59DRAFT_201784 [Aspergillus ambiguus]|uniref:uncharacterized protein n=1 Tax=Aspergillus ambiguus TaxID=176160 RepID=UPI003CCE2C1E